MKNIVCNTRCLNANFTGVQRYTTEILKGLPPTVDQMSCPPKLSRGLKGHAWEQMVLPVKMKGKLLFSPSNTGPVFYCNQVVVLHDIVPIDHPEWFNPNFSRWYRSILPILVKNVRHIIAISEFTKERIVTKLKVSEGKISVIYNGVDHAFFSTFKKSVQLQLPFKRYVLALSSIEPRKNIDLLLTVWRRIEKKLPEDVGLVIAGKTGNTLIFNRVILGDRPKTVHFTGYVEESEMASLYANAMFFCYLSSYEGFGLPPLEAMACGCPVLASKLTAVGEIVKDNGCLINPHDSHEIEESILFLINHDEARKTLGERGAKHSREFSWKDTCMKTWEVLQNFNS